MSRIRSAGGVARDTTEHNAFKAGDSGLHVSKQVATVSQPREFACGAVSRYNRPE